MQILWDLEKFWQKNFPKIFSSLELHETPRNQLKKFDSPTTPPLTLSKFLKFGFFLLKPQKSRLLKPFW